MLGFFTHRRREAARAAPFPDAWAGIIERNVPHAARLPAEDRAELEGHVQVFLAEKAFEGCGGLEITDEIRVTIAAQACILLLRRETDYYPTLNTILVYPHPYVAERKIHDGMLVHESKDVRLGESWERGPVVLAWDDVLHGTRDPRDGQNVVLHEFAHQLDQEKGRSDGFPALPSRSMYAPWARVLGEEYRELVEAVAHHRKSVLRDYAATSAAEFFAVATEVFFEKPVQLRRKHPELYEQLELYYRQDPASNAEAASASASTPDDEPRAGDDGAPE